VTSDLSGWFAIVMIRNDTRCTRSMHDQDQSGSPRLVLDLPELERHDTLILLDDSYRHRQANYSHEQYEQDDHIDSNHGLAFLAAAGSGRWDAPRASADRPCRPD
jgi:hypothetical protein